MRRLFQQLAGIDFREYAHLLNGYLVQPFQALGLGQSAFNEDGVQVFHVGETDELIDGGVIANVAFIVGVGISPLAGCHAEQGHVEHIRLIGIDKRGLAGRNLGGNEIVLDGIRVDPVVDFGEFALG